VPDLSSDIDTLEAQCLYVLWLRHQEYDSTTSDDPLSSEQVRAELAKLKGSTVRVSRVLDRLTRLTERGFATSSVISRDDGTAGRRVRGFRIASSDKIVKWAATAAVLHFLLHHELLPIPHALFIDEVLAKGFVDHKTMSPLTKSDLDRQIEYSLRRGYMMREKETAETYLLNVGERTKWEVHYLKLLSNHAQPGADLTAILRKPPSVSPESGSTVPKEAVQDKVGADDDESEKKAM
jgi:hypothetical protein